MIDLSHFRGSDELHRHSVYGRLYTEGIMELAEKANCFWLLDNIFSNVIYNKKLHSEEFLAIFLIKVKDDDAVIRFEDGNNNILYGTPHFFTDFPFGEVTGSYGSDDTKILMYFENDTLCLPDER